MAPSTSHGRRRAAPSVRIPAQRGPRDEPSGAEDGPISASTLLRREGLRMPHAADRPLRPRAHHVRVEPGGSWLDSVAVRRAGAAAGVIVAAASVFGAAVLSDVTENPTDLPSLAPNGPADAPPAADGQLPGLDLLGPVAPGTDVAVGGPVSLTAFDTPGAGPSTGSFLDPPAPATGPAAPPASAAGGGRSASSDEGTGGGSSSGPAERVLETVTEPVSGVTESAGDALPGLVGDTAAGLGETVHETGGDLGRALDGLAAPVTALLGGEKGTGASDRSSGSDSEDTSGSGSKRREPALRSLDADDERGGGLLDTVGRTAAGLLGG